MFLNVNILAQLQQDLFQDCMVFLPELILCGSIVLLLLLRLLKGLDPVHMGGVALVLTFLALAAAWCQWQGMPLYAPHPSEFDPTSRSREMFSGLLVYDNFTIFLRLFLLGFALLVTWLTLLTGIPDREDSADFYCLLLGATLGMSIMASANHLLMVYIGVEMASLPSYALAGFLKGRRQSSEAALKYVVYGGGASGVMLYGISLLAGKFGTAYLPDLAAGYAATLAHGGFDVLLLLGTMFVLIGVAFKLAAVPFHFWCPDVFEGASAEVAGFLSVASKGAALALLARIVLVLAGLGINTHGIDHAAWATVVGYLAPVLAFFAAVTATFGNLAAYLQTNLKRLLAYSTIAHAGYMMMGLAVLSADGASAVLLYLVAYLFMNLGAFAVVAFLRNETGSEDLADFRGLVRRSPWMVIALAIFLLSLLGMPPLAGFAAKFQIFSVLWKAGDNFSLAGRPVLSGTMYALLVIAGLNTVLSLVYYVKVLKVMIIDQSLDDVEGRPAVPLPERGGAKLYAALLVVAIFVVGLAWNPLLEASRTGVDHFRDLSRPAAAAVARGPQEAQP
jgi:NADH-quinone oxidoreductase subunit N